jgi:hypothetical protein
VNFPPEMKRLDQLIAAQERKIWRQARTVNPKPARPPRPAGSAVSDQLGAQ